MRADEILTAFLGTGKGDTRVHGKTTRPAAAGEAAHMIAVIRVYDEVLETHEHKDEFKEW